MIGAYIPSPGRGVWHLGPVPVRAYALAIVAGILVAIWVGQRRWTAGGGQPGAVTGVAMWAVPFGIAGGRAYHVLTDPQLYFGAGRDPVRALYIWQGGLGIPGAIALGALGAYIGCRRAGIAFAPFADALAPGIALAQAVGRWGNYFNQELFGRATTLPWALRTTRASDGNPPGLYHPTFLYESLWNIALAAVLVWAQRRFHLDRGRTFACYVAGYSIGRLWIETLRVDSANRILGLRLNLWTSAILLLGALLYLWRHRAPRGAAAAP